jgi:hypothetical protein
MIYLRLSAGQQLYSVVSRATGSVFMFCAPRLVFRGSEGVGSHFHVLRSRTHFRRYRGCRILFSCFARPDSFSEEMRVSGSVFMFCAPGVLSRGTEGVGSRFQVLRSRTRFLPVPRASSPVFIFCALGLVFSGIEGVGSHFIVLCSLTRFRRYRGRRLPFSCFARQNLFSTVPRASCPVFKFCSPGLIFGGTECVQYRFHALRSWTCFRRCRVRRVTFSCFAHPDSFSAVPRTMGPVFMFYAPGLVFCGTEGVGSRFLFLRAWTRFPRYRGCRVPFSCLALPESFRGFNPQTRKTILLFAKS